MRNSFWTFMWQLILLTLAASGAASYWLGGARGRRRLRDWRREAEACGLLVTRSHGPWRYPAALEGRAAPLTVRIDAGGRNGATRIAAIVPGPPDFAFLSIRSGPAPRLESVILPSLTYEITVGDEVFDTAFAIEGPARLAHALLDVKTRGCLLDLGAASRLEIAGGKLAVETSSRLSLVLPLFLRAVWRLSGDVDLPQRLGENARMDPEPGVRLQNLRQLVRELGDDPRTAEALRAAGSDASSRVRLWAAIELGAEGRGILAEIAESMKEDAASAEAVSLLAHELPFERLRVLLTRAVGRRHIETARVCLRAAGASGDPAAVEALAKVMAREQGELAAVAARALAATGSAAAEPPLILALQRLQPHLQAAAADALGRLGSAAAVQPLRDAAERSPRDPVLHEAARQAIAQIQARLEGASPGQLSLTVDPAGQLSLAPAKTGQLSLASDPRGQLALPAEEPGQLSRRHREEAGGERKP